MAEACAAPRRDADRRSSPARGSTPTSTSGSATPTTSGPGASWPTPARRSSARRRGRRRRRSRRRARRCSSPKAATGSGGTATTTRRTTTWSSTTCSGGTCGTSTGCCSKPVPDELFVSNISDGRGDRGADRRRSALTRADPRRRGDELLRVARRRHARGPRGRRARCTRPSAGAAHPHARAVRVRPRAPVRPGGRRRAGCVDLLADGHEFSLTFLHPVGVRSSCDGRRAADRAVLDARTVGAWPSGAARPAVAAGTVLEIGRPAAGPRGARPASRSRSS